MKHLSPSDRAYKAMDLQLHRSREDELRVSATAVTESPDPLTDAKTLCAWVARSMPPVSWPSLDDDWHLPYCAFFVGNRGSRKVPHSFSWSPPANEGCRHPDDHVIVASPNAPVQTDGRCFLRSNPTFFRPRVGHSQAPKTRALLDNCANLYLATKAFILRCIPSAVVHEGFTTGVDGIGSSHTVGYVHAPIYVDCMSRVGGKIGKVELNLEIHLIDGLPVDLIVGMDAICAYSIDTLISRSIATLSVRDCELAFPIEFRRTIGIRDPSSVDGFSVLCGTDIVISPFHEAIVDIITGSKPFFEDAWLNAIHVKNDNRLWSPLDGGWVAAGILRPDQTCPLFANLSSRSIRLRRGQMIGNTTMCGARDFLHPSAVVHTTSTTTPPSMLSCVPKRPSLHSGEVPPTSIMDPHNRKPLSETSSGVFDVSCAYGVDGTPPQIISQVLDDYHAAFSFDGRPGCVDSVSIPIDTDDDKLFPSPPRQVGPHKRHIIDASIDQPLSWDVIEPSQSRVSYPVGLVHQHDKWRFCVDYRELNLATTNQVYPMTRTDSIFDTLHGKRVFSILDAARGYHQLPIKESDWWKTAFITHRGLFHFKRIPFGLKNAPWQFQCFMDSVLGSLRWTAALVYIDDILVFSPDIVSHASHLRALLESAVSVGLRFNPSKYHFAYPSLTVLGHRVSADGLSVLEHRAAAIRELATPQTLKDLWHVLGVFGYYRQFIPKYAFIAAPLTRLTKGTRFQKLLDGTWQPREVSAANSAKTTLERWGSDRIMLFLH